MSYSLVEWTVTCGKCGGPSILNECLGRFGMVSIISVIKEKILQYAADHGVNDISTEKLSMVAELVLSNGSMRWSDRDCSCRKFIVINADYESFDAATFNALSIVTLVKN